MESHALRFFYPRLLLFLKRCFKRSLPFFLLAILFISCNKKPAIEHNHPEYVIKVLSDANIIRYTHGVDSSIAFLDSSYNALPDAGILDKYQKYEAILRMLFSGKPDYQKAHLYTDSIQYIIRENNSEKSYKKEFARAYFFEGDIAKADKKYDEAFAFYFQGKILVDESGDSCGLYQYYNKIANVYYEQRKFREAGEYYKKTSESLLHCGVGSNFNELFVERQGNLCNTGLCYMGRSMPDSALYYYQAALDFIDTNENKYPDKKRFMQIARSVIRGHMADVYVYHKKFGTAESLLKNSIATNVQKGNDNKYAQYSQHKLINLYLETGELEKAKAELGGLRSSLDTLANEDLEIKWYDLVSQYFLKNRDAANAFKSFRNYVALRDSLTYKKSREANVAQVLDRMEYEHKFELVQKEAELSRLYLMGMITATIMSMVIAFLIWQNWKRAKINVQGLKELNQQISEHNIHIQNVLGDLEKSQEQNTTMLKIVAHDLRSPIGSMHMATASLLEEDNYTRDQRNMLEMINASMADSMELIGNLMKTNTQSIRNPKELVAMHTMINYCVSMLKYKALEKEQKFELRLQKLVAPIDREKVWRVVSNLISNAIKFSPLGGVIEIDLERRENFVRILVKDRGIGIPDNYKNQIFDLYTDLGRRGTSGEESFGMGLSISRQIIQAHNGRLWFVSELGQGTTFYIELPLDLDQSE